MTVMDRLRSVFGFDQPTHEDAIFEFELSQLERRQFETEVLVHTLEARVAVLELGQDGDADALV